MVAATQSRRMSQGPRKGTPLKAVGAAVRQWAVALLSLWIGGLESLSADTEYLRWSARAQ